MASVAAICKIEEFRFRDKRGSRTQPRRWLHSRDSGRATSLDDPTTPLKASAGRASCMRTKHSIAPAMLCASRMLAVPAIVWQAAA
jgi:hypothetical protein